MIVLHHAPKSRSSRVVWLLEELGAPYTLKITDIPRMDGSGHADPGNPHPDRKVPALVDDGVLVTESAAIMLYLTDRFPAANVGPAIGDPNRGAYLTWLAYYAGVIEPIVAFGFAGVADNAVLTRTFRDRAAMDRRILGALENGPYVLGEKFSAVDILLAGMADFDRRLMPAAAEVDAYLDRMSGRPARERARAKDNG